MSGDYLYLYHEKQVAGLCAVHALNTLLQDAIFNPVDLMQIAQEFDTREKEQMMASVRESSQQERRVYVGNLSYDVKWHHLKDFMRQGKISYSL